MWPVQTEMLLLEGGLIQKGIYYVDGLCAIQVLLGRVGDPLLRRAYKPGGGLPYNLAYKPPLQYKSPWFISPPPGEGRCPALTKFVWRTDHLHSKSTLL
jgi:hypothetical protein